MTTATSLETTRIELPVVGMDCANCAQSVRQALTAVPGVTGVDVLLGAEKAIVVVGPGFAGRPALRAAVVNSGYASPEPVPATMVASPIPGDGPSPTAIGRRVLAILGLVTATVLLLVVGGEWAGWLDPLTDRVPFPVGVAFVAAFGFPVFRNVLRATLRRKVISHTLMSVGVLAALAVGQWETAAIVVLFMRLGDLTERLTTDRGRRAVRDLAAMAPRSAIVVDGDSETDTPIDGVRPGDVVLVRPGGMIPVDGTVVAGTASVSQAAITGESMPFTATAGTAVVAAGLVTGGSLRVRAERIGVDSTFGQVIRLVEAAEADRGETQRLADRFSGWFLPVVAVIATLTFAISRDPIATAAVLVVACSCSLALATPVAMLATIGTAARRGLLIKGGRHVETLARADVVLVDKTGTLTTGHPGLVALLPLGDLDRSAVLALAAAVERDSEHPLAGAIRAAARLEGVPIAAAIDFRTETGSGVEATVGGHRVRVGTSAFAAPGTDLPGMDDLRADGQTVIVVSRDDVPVAILGIADSVRPEVAAAIGQLRGLGIRRIELLTGDHDRSAAAVATTLGIDYRAGLLPSDKIRIVRDYQSAGHTVVMVGDGINDAPALAQADVGVAMAAGGTAIAREAAHVALLRDDWSLVPEAIRSARRTMGVVRMNLGFTAVYNIVGLSLAAAGILPPVAAAAAQSLPDLGIMLNSARLLRKPDDSVEPQPVAQPVSTLEPSLPA